MLNRLRLRLRALLRKAEMERELDEELRFHLEKEAEQNLARGMGPEEARLAALRSFGGVEQVKEESRDVRGVQFMEELWQDLRYGARMLFRKPGFTSIAVLTLSLGIGANTAIFTVVDAALLRGLPYRDADRLVQVWETRRVGEIKQLDASYPDYLDWGRQPEVVEGICGYTGWGGSFTLTGRAEPERIEGARVTASFFSVLGVAPLLGRTFLPDEDRPQAERTVILSYGLWQRRFGADPNIVGQSLMLDGSDYTVLGVLPSSFQFAPMGKAQLWVPLRPTEFQLNRRYMHWLDVIVRLKPGISLEQAQAQMSAISERIERENPDSHTGAGLKLVPLHEQIIGSVGSLLLVLLGAVGCVLLIACANVANLLLLRAAARRQEISIRLALGATRWRIVRQLLSESLLLTLVGGVLGLVLASWGVQLLLAAIPATQLDSMPYLEGLTLNARVFGFTGALSLLTGVVFGLAPAWQSVKLDLQAVLKDSNRTGAGTGRQRFRSLLVVSEIALALVLLVGAGLLIKSTLRLLEVKLGFNPERLMTMQLELPLSRYSDDEQARAFHQQLLARIEALPGVAGVASVNWLPLEGGPVDLLRVEGQPPPPPGEVPKTTTHVVSPNYFRTMGIALVKGRYFTDNDNQSSPRVLVINGALAERLFANQDPIGRRVILEGGDERPFEIVGVVDDERVGELDEEAAAAVVYHPFLQEPWTKLNLVVRTAGDPTSIVNAVRGEVHAIDPDLALYSVATMEQLIAERPSTFLRRYPALLMALFAAIALILAAIGIYGVISYSVNQRTHEIGVRMALGAQAGDVLRLIIGQGMVLILFGVAGGVAAALALTRLMRSLLFSVSATDPLTFILVTALLVLVALLACYIPARRATKVDPMTALRYE
ncbi:MAG TPA: ABC transporter permease [Pyrinomonadaceae bacterium]|jgi:putative ABC transport system permease protein|nr:ABC transporter permease [Pyrinomonadaceae bacterium]